MRKVNWNPVPRGRFGANHSRPSCASMIARQIDSPIPIPSGLVVKSGLNNQWSVLRADSRSGVRDRYGYVATFVHLGLDAQGPSARRSPPSHRLAFMIRIQKHLLAAEHGFP